MATFQAEIIVEGLVQGVGYRWFVRGAAQRRNIIGYVQNLPNGSVQIVAEGDRGILLDLIKEVRIGPMAAQVTDIHVEWMEPEPEGLKSTQFEIR